MAEIVTSYVNTESAAKSKQHKFKIILTFPKSIGAEDPHKLLYIAGKINTYIKKQWQIRKMPQRSIIKGK